MSKPSREEDSELLANAARMARVLLKATPHDLIQGTEGRTQCPGKVRVPKGWGWLPCSNFLERGNSLCSGPCQTTWGPR